MGEVYRAHDSRLKRDVALKVLPADVADDAERLARFQREAEVLASLNHPHIAHVYGIEANALVMELVDGEDLSQRLSRGAIPLDEALAIAKQIADALEAAHDAGIVHRDLKPANVKLTEDGTVKVLDFGLAKALDRTAPAPHLAHSPTITSPAMTMQGVILGTAAYMAPEQAKGKPVDKRADIWAFGCVLYEMLTGRRAFDGDDVTDLIAAVVSKEPDWTALPASTPPHVRRALQRCLAKDRRQRMRDVGDARHDLLDPPQLAGTVATGSRAPRWIVGLAAVALLAAMALAYPAIQHWREQPARPRAIRATIDAPPQTARLLSPEISPDGQSLLFSALALGSPSPRVWIRRLDQAMARPIEGVAASGSPFWSPDGRSFGYPSREGLMVYDLSTSSSRLVSKFGSTLGGLARFLGTWSAEHGIVYGLSSRIFHVSADGESRPIQFEGLAANGDSRFPVFLPDGRHLLFLSGPDGEQAFIHVAAIEGTGVRKLIAADSQAVYAEPSPGRGHLLFIKDGALMAQPFDARSMEVHGSAHIVAGDVPVYAAEFFGTGRGHFAVSRDGLVVFSVQAAALVSKLTWFNRSGAEVGTIGEPALYFGPRIAPDGRRVAVARLDPRTRLGDIHVLGGEGGDVRLTFAPGNEFMPVWTPDGKYVIYGGQEGGRARLLRKRADGTGSDEVLHESDYSMLPDDVSADGKYVVFRESHPVTQNDLWVLPLDGSGKARPILNTPADEPRARFSPDGKIVTFMADSSRGLSQAFALSFPDLESRWQVSEGSGNVPQWRHDSKEIVYQSSTQVISQAVLGTMPLRLGERVVLFRPPLTPRGSFFHATGDLQRFLFSVEPPPAEAPQYHVLTSWMKTP
jgi:serine/threonine protein kinase